MGGLDQNPYVNTNILYIFIKNSKNRLAKSLLYQWKDSLWINPKLANLSAHAFSSRKIWVILNLIVPQKLRRQVFNGFF